MWRPIFRFQPNPRAFADTDVPHSFAVAGRFPVKVRRPWAGHSGYHRTISPVGSRVVARTILILLVATIAAAASPLPQPKVGQCPSGYRESGGYCAPTSPRVPAAVPKTGQCQSGWMQSGAYCVEMKRGR
jgi:hypothetical protein